MKTRRTQENVLQAQRYLVLIINNLCCEIKYLSKSKHFGGHYNVVLAMPTYLNTDIQ